MDIPINIWLPAAAALGGALIGSLAPMAVSLITARAEHRRERMRLAVQLAVEDFRQAVENRKANGGRGMIPPVSTYLAFHADLLAHVARGKTVTAQDLLAMNVLSNARVDALVQADKEARANKTGRWQPGSDPR